MITSLVEAQRPRRFRGKIYMKKQTNKIRRKLAQKIYLLCIVCCHFVSFHLITQDEKNTLLFAAPCTFYNIAAWPTYSLCFVEANIRMSFDYNLYNSCGQCEYKHCLAPVRENNYVSILFFSGD